MLTGNKFFKLNNNAEVTRITTDDIPEGEYNKYCLDYPDGKLIGDIILRPSPDELACHTLLNGQIVYEFDCKDFYAMCLDYKIRANEDDSFSNFNKTLEEYDEFLATNTWEETNQPYCPYYVVDTQIKTIYEVTKDNLKGYTDLAGEADIEVASGYIYDDINLTNTIDVCEDWFYTGVSEESRLNFVKLATYPTYVVGDTKAYYFIVTNSRVDDNTTSIRSVSVGETHTLDVKDKAFVRNVGTMQNLILDFGIPSGKSGTMQIGEVESGEFPSIENVGNETDAILNFVLPKGDRGDAGGAILLKEVVDVLPESASRPEDRYYLTTENAIYQFINNEWIMESEADSGLIYLNNSNIYYYDGENLISTHSISKVDDLTIKINEQGAIENVATKNVQGGIIYDWVGTLKEWEQGRANGSILDNYICFVIDD